MSPSPLSPSTVHVLLRYIAPPSQLTHPLPPHLLSKPLLQRHHFLQLSPDDPEGYLCWPSDQRGRVVELLEDRTQQDDEPVAYPVRYTADGETAYAHVSLSLDGVRLVFQWDHADEWRFHNAALMPFPVDSHHSPSNSADTVQPVKDVLYDDHNNLDNEDDYWNAYDAQDEQSSVPDDHAIHNKDVEAGTEDAYWAQYSSVHGTADSTRPSPPPQPKRRLQHIDAGFDSRSYSSYDLPVPAREGPNGNYDCALSILPGVQRPDFYSRFDPASPRALAQLLATASPRASVFPSPIVTPLKPDFVDSDITSPTVGGSSGSDDSDTPLYPIANPVKEHSIGTSDVQKRLPSDEVVDEEVEGFKESVRGLWRIWNTSQRRRNAAWPPLVDEAHHKEAFLAVVRDVIENA